MTAHIVITERWTRTDGWRRVGYGPWEPIDLTPYGGKVPIAFGNDVQWIMQEIWQEPGEQQ